MIRIVKRIGPWVVLACAVVVHYMDLGPKAEEFAVFCVVMAWCCASEWTRDSKAMTFKERAACAFPIALGIASFYKSEMLAEDHQFAEASYTLLSGAAVTTLLWFWTGIGSHPGTKR